jgi:hypothetical protein
MFEHQRPSATPAALQTRCPVIAFRVILARVAFAPTFGHRGQGRRATKNQVCRIGPNALQEGELGIEIYVETRGNLKKGILENLGSVAAAPAHYVLIAGVQ